MDKLAHFSRNCVTIRAINGATGRNVLSAIRAASEHKAGGENLYMRGDHNGCTLVCGVRESIVGKMPIDVATANVRKWLEAGGGISSRMFEVRLLPSSRSSTDDVGPESWLCVEEGGVLVGLPRRHHIVEPKTQGWPSLAACPEGYEQQRETQSTDHT